MDLERFKLIITDYLGGKLTEEEKGHVDDWYESISNEDTNSFIDANHREKIKQDLFIRVGIAEAPVGAKKVANIPVRKFSWLSAAAAILIVGGISLLFFQHNPMSLSRKRTETIALLMETVTNAGELKEIQLPDGTSIFLNGNTRIRYDRKNFASNRKFFLDRGEAFFRVRRDTLHPFKIETGSVSVAVLGTSFNVNNSMSTKQVTVEVKTGRVSVLNAKNGANHILTAGKAVRYNVAHNGFETFDSDPAYISLWTQGGMQLNNIGFKELKEVIYNRFGVMLHTDNLNTDSFNYSLMIPHVESLNQVLTIVCNIHQIKFRREKNEIILYK
ncbi:MULTISPECIES: FecR family protein [unclassified Sphingobacterium]|uniref:FecR family protein n=1 Tax=unclassified Sphingobacterium TaxID=2609468 RepID=UPI0025E0709B|nr:MULTISPECIES: FecR family protein [unclassified Sphingobacterium]